jgi:hypothetical protein
MDFEVFVRFLTPSLIIFLGIMLKLSVNDGWSSYKKYWLFFILLAVYR